MPDPASATDLVRQLVREHLIAWREHDERRAAFLTDLERKGERLVTGDDPTMNDDTWRVVDWRTNEVIAEGDDGEDGYNAAFERLDPGKTWHHIDRATTAHGDVDPLPNTVMPGLPPSLCEVLVEWVEDQRATDEELAEFIGWPVEQVRGCRDQT